MASEEAVRITVKTVVGDYVITLKMADARGVLGRFAVVSDTLEPTNVARYLAVMWLSNAIKADEGRAGTEDANYLNYKADSGENVSVRSTAVLAIETSLVPVTTGMGFGSISSDPEPERAE